MKHLLHPNRGLIWAGTISVLILFGVLIVASGTFSQLPYMTSGAFWGVWILKNMALIASLSIPVVLGMTSPNAQRRPTKAIGILLGFWILVILVKTIMPAVPNGAASSYLIKKCGPMLLCYLGLLFFGPQLSQRLCRLSLSQLRRLTGGFTGIYLLASLTTGTDWLGIGTGQTIVMFGYLFLLGHWLLRDPLLLRLHRLLLVLGTIFSLGIALLISWFMTNRVAYDPHHGLTTSQHYLDAISWNQPVMIMGLVGILLIFRQTHRLPRQLSVIAQSLLGTSILWLITPQLCQAGLTAVFRWSRQLPVLGQLSLLLLIAIFLTGMLAGIIGSILILIQQSPKTAINWHALLLRLTVHAWRTWLLIGVTWLITVISIWHLWDWRLNMIQWVILHRELIIFINVLMVYALFAILMAIFNRFWWSAIITLTCYTVWLVVNVIKISDRSEPVLPADTSMVTSLSSIQDLLKLVSPAVIAGVLILIIATNLLAWWLQRRDPKIRWRTPQRVIMMLLAVLLLSSFRFANHPDSITAKSLSDAGDRPYFYSQLRAAKLNGTLLQFANNIDVTIMHQPQGYSKTTMRRLEKRYQHTADQVNAHRRYASMAHQSVIFVLSESFADPKDVPNLHVQGDPLPYLHQLEKTTTSGKMISSGYGGGTANMEYQALTGLSLTNFSPTLPTPYSQLVPYQKQTFAISDLFNYRVAIHPFTANLYNRKQVYQKLGFNQFYHLEGGNQLSYTAKIQHSPYISDASAYSQTIKQLKGHTGGQFINLVTMQNHMPFDNYYDHDDYPVSGTAYLDAQHKRNIENYIQGIHYTDTALKQFNHELDQIHKPVTVVWYGDHLPGIYNGDSMQQYGIALHATDYLIYGNRYSPAHHVQLSKHRVVTPNDFAAMLLAQMNVKVSPYYALLTKVYEDLPAMALNSFDGAANNTANGSSEMVDDNGQLVLHLTKRQKQLLHDYRLVQYDLTAGKGYLASHAFMDR